MCFLYEVDARPETWQYFGCGFVAAYACSLRKNLWLTKNFTVSPQRSAKGHRSYREKDVAVLRRIKQLLHEQGMTIEGARKVLNSPQGGSPLESSEAASAPAVDTAFLGEIAGELIEIRNMLSTEEEK